MRRKGQDTDAGPGGTPGLLRLSGIMRTALVLAALLGAAPGWAEQAAPAIPGAESTAGQGVAGQGAVVLGAPVLILDFERLFDESRWGQRIAADLAVASAELNTENNRIADDLIDEEKALTERRAGMPAELFRAEADAFDERATAIRAAQKAKVQALSQSYDAARQGFLDAVAPLIDEVLAGRGAVVVLDRRAVLRALPQADITDDLVALIDARLGAGPEAAPTTAPAPAPTAPAPTSGTPSGTPSGPVTP